MNKTFIYGYLLEKPNSGDAETAVIDHRDKRLYYQGVFGWRLANQDKSPTS